MNPVDAVDVTASRRPSHFPLLQQLDLISLCPCIPNTRCKPRPTARPHLAATRQRGGAGSHAGRQLHCVAVPQADHYARLDVLSELAEDAGDGHDAGLAQPLR